MADAPYKFGHLVVQDDRRYDHADTFEIESTTGPLRLKIAPSRDHLALLMELAEHLSEPFKILYVLVVSRGQHEPGRYESGLLSRQDVASFLSRFRDYLENDGRHHLWLMSEAGGPIVYDNHNILLAYGPIEAYEGVLHARGFVNEPVRYPVPHSHHYHARFDPDAAALLEYWQWERFPLVEDVDDP